ncbi:MAG TPA: ribosome biogenesis GTPase YlqF [Firmicutes bacterium]|nr:ribosome biogenesis GTPase YlqF [Bacillota bacterium]
MTIQWYPGHMARARRMIEKQLKLVDGVLELIDARIPFSSRNPDFKESVAKPRILLFTKTDLADPILTAAWMGYWQAGGSEVIAADLLKGTGLDRLNRAIQNAFGHLKRKPRLLVVGIPNVGKSTLINRLAGRRGARVGARPGVTRGKQWLNTATMQLLDSPGILWPKFGDQNTAKKLAAVASIRDEIFDQGEIAFWLLNFLQAEYPAGIKERYGEVDPRNLLEEIGRLRGCLLRGGIVDYNQTAALVLKDFRTGKLGRVTLDHHPSFLEREE